MRGTIMFKGRKVLRGSITYRGRSSALWYICFSAGTSTVSCPSILASRDREAYRGRKVIRVSVTFRGRSFLVISASFTFRSHRETGMRHNIQDELTNLVESPALHSEPDPAGLVVDGRDWAERAVDRALGCFSGLNSA